MNKKILSIVILSALGSGLWAVQENSDAGSQAVPWLKLSNNAAAAGMGEAGAALARDVNTLNSNPGGLGMLEGHQLALQHNVSFQDQAIEHVAYSGSFMEKSSMAVSIDYIDFGTIEGFDINAAGQPVSTGDLSVSGMAAAAGYGQQMGVGISLGASFKYISQDIAGVSSSGFAADLGFLWSQGETGLSAGLAAQNVGGKFDDANLPTNVKVGVAYQLSLAAIPSGRLLAAVDGNIPTVAADATSVGLGLELAGSKLYAIRAGYKVSGNDGPTGFTAGAGLIYGRLGLDYAFGDQGDIGQTHQVSLLARF